MIPEKIPSGAGLPDEPMDGATSEDLIKSLSTFSKVHAGLLKNGGIAFRRLKLATNLHPLEVDLLWGYTLLEPSLIF
jgi:hypothetical protein